MNLRMHLSKEEVERYREIGAACAQIVEGICKEAKSGQTEVGNRRTVEVQMYRTGDQSDCVFSRSG